MMLESFKVMVRKLFLLTLVFLLISSFAFAEKPQKYMPYPVVFVSGIKTTLTSPSEVWPNSSIFKEFKKYFLNGEDNNAPPKYDDEGSDNLGEVSHLEFFFFDAQQDTLAYNASLLKAAIENILKLGGRYYKSDYTYTEPCSTSKVILVCHSLGGLIARYMLVNHPEMQDKVAAVFFLGVPQQGSPLAVVGYFLPKEIPALKKDIEDIEDIIDSEDMEQWKKEQYLNMIKEEESKIEGNLRFMGWAESEDGLYTSTRDSDDSKDIISAISGNKDWEDLFKKLPLVTEKGVIKAALINDLAANKYRHTFRAYSDSGKFDILAGREALVRSVPVDGPLSYDLSESELSKEPLRAGNIGVTNVHAIVGTEYFWLRTGLYNTADWFMGAENFNENDYSCVRNGFWADGDGVASFASQGKIGKVHMVDAVHTRINFPLTNIPIPNLTGETNHPDTPNIILQAIDDAPVIEKVYAIPEDWNKTYATSTDDSKSWYYLIFKLKDYLLADIEIESLTLDGQDKIPASFKKDGVAKPYHALGKRFLEERYCNDEQKELAEYYDIFNDKGDKGVKKYLHLLPGEFFIKTKIPLNAQSLYIKIKNPASKYAQDADNFSAKKTFYFYRPQVVGVDWYPHWKPPYYLFWGSYIGPFMIDVPPLFNVKEFNARYGPPNGGFYAIYAAPAPTQLNLFFKIQNSPTQVVKSNIWIYNGDWSSLYYENLHPKYAIVQKRLLTNERITLQDGTTLTGPDGNPITLYSRGYSEDNPITTWAGEKEEGNYVLPYPDYGWCKYEVKITIEPVDCLKDNVIPLLGSNWDGDDFDVYDVITTDPTFIQVSRREGVSW